MDILMKVKLYENFDARENRKIKLKCYLLIFAIEKIINNYKQQSCHRLT